MREKILSRLIIATLVCAGIVAGVFFAFSSFVMPALGSISPESGISAMQAINTMAVNPKFMLCFMGATLFSTTLFAYGFMRWSEAGSAWLIVGSACYLFGCFIVTATANVPLNDALAHVDPHAVDAAVDWQRYIHEWTQWNHVRTVCATLTMLCMAVAVRMRGCKHNT